jgi:hypothetical protein
LNGYGNTAICPRIRQEWEDRSYQDAEAACTLHGCERVIEFSPPGGAAEQLARTKLRQIVIDTIFESLDYQELHLAFCYAEDGSPEESFAEQRWKEEFKTYLAVVDSVEELQRLRKRKDIPPDADVAIDARWAEIDGERERKQRQEHTAFLEHYRIRPAG